MKLRTILLGLAALFVAINAAYFSVLGLSKLFAGSSTAVIVMASSLELAKLITASFLYNYWDRINKALRVYLMIGVFVLITITSAGIYGFLTSAYQTTSDQLTMLDKRVELVETKKDRYEVQYNELSMEKSSLQETIIELSKGLSNNVIQYKDKESGQIITTTSSRTRKVLTSQLNDNKEQRDKISVKMEVLSDSITSLDLQALEIRSTDEVAGEVGPLKYLSKMTGKPMDTIVNWFALFIIFVFDPLAVTLIVAFNVAMKVDKGIKTKEEVENSRTMYGESEKEWDGIGESPKTKEEIEKEKNSIEDSKKLVKKVEDGKAWDRLFGEEEVEPNDDLKKAARNFEKFLDDIREEEKIEQEKHLEEIVKLDQENGLYDESQVKTDEVDINDIELVDEEHIHPMDVNKDNVITPDEQRNHYEISGWKNSYQNKPFYFHPWFNWEIPSRWINNPEAVQYWKRYRAGTQTQLDKYKKYPTDFENKSY